MNISEILYQVVLFLTCVFEIYILYDLLVGKFEIYEKQKNILFVEMVISGLIIYLINRLNNPTLNLLSVPVVMFLFICLAFRIDVKQNFLYLGFYSALLAISEFAFYHIYILAENSSGSVDLSKVFYTIIKAVFMFAVVKIINKKNQDISNKCICGYPKSLFVLPLASLVLLNGFVLSKEHPVGYFFACIGGILLVVSNVVGFSTVEKMLEAEHTAKNAELLALKSKLEQSHYQRMEEINQSYAEYLHEMGRVIRTINYLANKEENNAIKVLVDEVVGLGEPTAGSYYIEDQITNAIFIEREKQTFEKSISYQVDIQPGVDLTFVDNIDKISMFGNLLDNAIEAAEGCDNGYVCASLYKGNDTFTIFRVENSFNCLPKKVAGRYLSIKQDKNKHGFGLKKVEELVGNYGGILNYYEEDHVFVAVLMLSNLPKSV